MRQRSFRLPKPLPLALALAAASGIAGAQATTQPAAPNGSATAPARPGLQYPQTKTVDVVDDYHGTKVADPYRWLEDVDSPDTKAWVEAQNKVTFGYLESIPERERIRARLTTVWNYPKYATPWKEGGKYFYFENSGLQSQSVLYVQEKLGGPARVLLDPNTLSSDGTVALNALSVSKNGRYLGYGVSASGSDWQEFRVRDVETGKDLADTLKWIKFSGMSWTGDHKGFFYSRYDQPTGNQLTGLNKNQKLYYHRLGTPQSQDVLVYQRPDQPDWGFSGRVTHDGRYLVINISEGTDPKNRVYIVDLDLPRSPKITAPPVKVFDKFDASYDFVGNVGERFFFQTTNGAPRGRVIAVNLARPQERNWTTVIPESRDALQSVTLAGDRLVAEYLQDARSAVRTFTLSGAPVGEIALPGLGSVGSISGRPNDPEIFYSFTTYLAPATIYRHDLKTKESTVLKSATLPVDVSEFETKQVFYTSKDGTRVPMFITARKGVKLDGNNPTLLYAYGGFNSPQVPGFSPARLVWLEMGGVLAIANLRGGGEYGEEWHRAGTKERKQNVFDDFIAAAEYLVNEKYTKPSKLAIQGGSNGGLLVGAAMTQRPELFGAALPAVGVMDMLRFHKFTIGWAWTSDYGSSDDPEAFKYLHAYSPLHNLKPGTKYPATLVTTADHDDRVVPGHSFKFAAALQAAHAGDAPVLIRIESKAGHGAGKPTAKRIEEAADIFAFLVKTLDIAPVTLP